MHKYCQVPSEERTVRSFSDEPAAESYNWLLAIENEGFLLEAATRF